MENLGIDYKLLIAQIINFGLFFFLFRKFIAKPFTQFIHEEQKKEEEKQKAMVEIKTSQERIQQQEKEKRLELRKEMDTALDHAKQDALALKQDLIKNAQNEAAVIISNGHKHVEEERKNMLKEIKGQVGKISVLMVSNALTEYIDDETRTKITQHILSNSPKDTQL